MKAPRLGKPLDPRQIALLREVIERHAPELTSLLPRAEINLLDRKEREMIIEAISDELMKSGIGKDYEPLPKGLELEELLAVINRPNLLPD